MFINKIKNGEQKLQKTNPFVSPCSFPKFILLANLQSHQMKSYSTVKLKSQALDFHTECGKNVVLSKSVKNKPLVHMKFSTQKQKENYFVERKN